MIHQCAEFKLKRYNKGSNKDTDVNLRCQLATSVFSKIKQKSGFTLGKLLFLINGYNMSVKPNVEVASSKKRTLKDTMC